MNLHSKARALIPLACDVEGLKIVLTKLTEYKQKKPVAPALSNSIIAWGRYR